MLFRSLCRRSAQEKHCAQKKYRGNHSFPVILPCIRNFLKDVFYINCLHFLSVPSAHAAFRMTGLSCCYQYMNGRLFQMTRRQPHFLISLFSVFSKFQLSLCCLPHSDFPIPLSPSCLSLHCFPIRTFLYRFPPSRLSYTASPILPFLYCSPSCLSLHCFPHSAFPIHLLFSDLYLPSWSLLCPLSLPSCL